MLKKYKEIKICKVLLLIGIILSVYFANVKENNWMNYIETLPVICFIGLGVCFVILKRQESIEIIAFLKRNEEAKEKDILILKENIAEQKLFSYEKNIDEEEIYNILTMMNKNPNIEKDYIEYKKWLKIKKEKWIEEYKKEFKSDDFVFEKIKSEIENTENSNDEYVISEERKNIFEKLKDIFISEKTNTTTAINEKVKERIIWKKEFDETHLKHEKGYKTKEKLWMRVLKIEKENSNKNKEIKKINLEIKIRKIAVVFLIIVIICSSGACYVAAKNKEEIENIKIINIEEKNIEFTEQTMKEVKSLQEGFEGKFYINEKFTRFTFNNCDTYIAPIETENNIEEKRVPTVLIIEKYNGHVMAVITENKINYSETKLLNKNIYRLLYTKGFKNYNFTSAKFIIDSEYNGFWLIGLTKQNNIQNFDDVEMICVINATSGELRVFDVKNLPIWIKNGNII